MTLRFSALLLRSLGTRVWILCPFSARVFLSPETSILVLALVLKSHPHFEDDRRLSWTRGHFCQGSGGTKSTPCASPHQVNIARCTVTHSREAVPVPQHFPLKHHIHISSSMVCEGSVSGWHLRSYVHCDASPRGCLWAEASGNSGLWLLTGPAGVSDRSGHGKELSIDLQNNNAQWRLSAPWKRNT